MSKVGQTEWTNTPTWPTTLPVGECVCFLIGFFDFLGIGGSLSPSGDGLLADLFLGRPRSRRYPKFNIGGTSPLQFICVFGHDGDEERKRRHLER